MNNQEIYEMFEKERIRNEKITKEAIEKLHKEFPQLEVNQKNIVPGIIESRYYHNALEYYLIKSIYGVSKFDTSYAFNLQILKKYGKPYKILEINNRIYLISDWESCLGATVYVFNQRGERIKGERYLRKTHQTSKGWFIEINKKRYYLNQ